jgi:hypothetical protein
MKHSDTNLIKILTANLKCIPYRPLPEPDPETVAKSVAKGKSQKRLKKIGKDSNDFRNKTFHLSTLRFFFTGLEFNFDNLHVERYRRHNLQILVSEHEMFMLYINWLKIEELEKYKKIPFRLNKQLAKQVRYSFRFLENLLRKPKFQSVATKIHLVGVSVSDQGHVFVKFGKIATAARSRKGNRKWVVPID